MKTLSKLLVLVLCVNMFSSCQSEKKNSQFKGEAGEIKLMVVDPAHFHADLLLKENNVRINRDIFVYAPQGIGLSQHLDRVKFFNSRTKNPTNWNLTVYDGDDYFDSMLQQPAGNVVVLAGN